MRSFKTITIFFVMLFAMSLVVPANDAGLAQIGLTDSRYAVAANLPMNKTFENAFLDNSHFRVHDDTQYFDGLNLFTMMINPNHTEAPRARDGYIMVMDMDGNIRNGFFNESTMGSPKLINSTTAMFTKRDYDGVYLWNWVTNKTEALPIPEGHHEVTYNPVTDTFLTIQLVNFIENYTFQEAQWNITGDDIVEYDRDGTELWRWEGNLTFPFNWDEYKLRNETRDDMDWMHSNSIYWDIDNDMIYMNVRHLDCVVAVNYTSGETEWVVGRYVGEGPGMTLYNKAGEEVDSLFYHAHACEKIGPNNYILYDNDYKNLTRADIDIGITRYVEFAVDETAMTATEVWSWTSPESYYTRAQGDTNRLPNGNSIGVHNQGPSPFMVEVNQAGEIVWEMTINKTTEHIGWGLNPNGHMRFTVEPTIVLAEPNMTIPSGGIASVEVSVWDIYQKPTSTSGTITATTADMVVLANEDFDFLPHWEETEIVLELEGLADGIHYIQILVENDEGIQHEKVVRIEVVSNLPLYLAIGGAAVLILVVVVYFWSKKKSA
jgi:hypothetical protein